MHYDEHQYAYQMFYEERGEGERCVYIQLGI